MIRRLFFPICLLLVGCEPLEVQKHIARGQRQLSPVLAALKQHKAARGRYPPTLNALVESKAIESIPVLHWRKRRDDVQQAEYEVAPDGSFFTLHFGYLTTHDEDGEVLEESVYISDEERWRTGVFQPTFREFYSKRNGLRYQREKSAESLDLAVKYLFWEDGREVASIPQIWDHQVTDCLGPGLPIKPPHPLLTKTQSGLQYDSVPDQSRSYFFVFAYRELPTLDAGGSFTNRQYPLVFAVYKSQPAPTGGMIWKQIATRP